MDDPNVNNTAVVIINTHIAQYQSAMETMGPLGKVGATDCIRALEAVRADILIALATAAELYIAPASPPPIAPGGYEPRPVTDPSDPLKKFDWFPVVKGDTP